MCKQNTSSAVPLDAVLGRRTERCSPRFRPGDRFCELSFRYLLPGCREMSAPTTYVTDSFHPLNPFRNLLHFLYIQLSVLIIYSMWYIQVCLGTVHVCLLQKYSIQGSEPLFKSCCVPYSAGANAQDRKHFRMRQFEQTRTTEKQSGKKRQRLFRHQCNSR